MMEARFYAWFLNQLLELLEGQVDGVDAAAEEVRSGQADVTVTRSGERLPRTSNATRRPGETSLFIHAAGRHWQLGDDPRSDLVIFPVDDEEPVIPPSLLPWMPPQPVMLPLAPASSVNAPAFAGQAAHAFHPSADGLFDAGFDREAGTGFCPPLPPGLPAIEPTGVFVTVKVPACEADTKTRPEHLSTNSRFNLRLPVMAGVENGRTYKRVVRAPMKTFEYRGGQ